MANSHGGYRKPTNPAPVSGPGQHSRRTDGQPTLDLPNAQYGQNSAFKSIESGAQMATQPQPAPPDIQPAAQPIVGMGEPSQQPNTPVTDGAAAGPGAGPEALNLPQDLNNLDAEDLRRYLPALIDVADRDDTPAGTKQWVRSIIANMNQ